MKDQHIVNAKTDVKASPSRVWEALTDPAQTRKFFFGCRVSSDWKEGSLITFSGKFLWMKIVLKGKILKIDPGRLLQYTLVNQKSVDPSHFSLVTIELSGGRKDTHIVVTDDVGPYEGVEKRFRRSVKGWKKILKGLKKLVEKDS